MDITRRILTASAFSAFMLGGCGGSRVTAPLGDEFDVAAAGTANATITRLMGGLGMTSVAALGPLLPADLGLVATGTGETRWSAPTLAEVALRLLHSLPTADGPMTVPVIRPAALGLTYVYRSEAHRYVPDPRRPGAPANGVRFILYQVDPATHLPVPGQETGFADLTDQGGEAGMAVSLRLRAIADGRTFLDYAFTLAPTLGGGGSLRLAGFLADELHRLDFTIGATTQSLGGGRLAQVTFDLALPSGQFHATGSINAATGGPADAVQLVVAMAVGPDVIHLIGDATPAAVVAALSVNGRLFATVTGDPRHPTIRGNTGRGLSPAEMQVLGGLVVVVSGALEVFGHLIEPIAAILGVALWL